jgi:hypothetical protein
MSFRFSTAGNRINDELYARLKQARRIGLHGELVFVKARSSHRFEVHFSDGTQKVLAGEVRLMNLLQRDIEAEPARRILWKASHPGGSDQTVGIDERIVETSVSAETDQDLAHHRKVGANS